MKKLICLAVILLSMAQSSVSNAAIVSTVLTLDLPTPAVNTLKLTLLSGVIPIDTDDSVLSGTIIADIDIDQVTGVITSLNLTGGSMVGTAWSMFVPVPVPTTLNGSASTATGDTNPDTSVVLGSIFPAAQHRILLTSGTVSPVGVDLTNTSIEGIGDGTLTATKNGNQFDIFFSMNVDDREVLAGADLAIQGTVVGRGTVTAIPEPASLFALTALVSVVAVRRRR